MAPALERNWAAVQSHHPETLPRHQLFPVVGLEIRFALLAHAEAGKPTWRIGSQRRAVNDDRVLESRRSPER
jgi:hypothetical protein